MKKEPETNSADPFTNKKAATGSARKLRFMRERDGGTGRQRLYEGVDLVKKGIVAVITYMRYGFHERF